MTGCTFGSVRYRSGAVEVCHANYQTDEGGIDEARMHRETAWCTKRIEQSQYREQIRGKAFRESTPRATTDRQARMGATIVGINNHTKGWTFYAQQWENLDGTNYNYIDLIEL
jgi:hypothetical protein